MRKSRQQFQRGYIEVRRRGGREVYVGRWREAGERKSVVLGFIKGKAAINKSAAQVGLAKALEPVNAQSWDGTSSMTLGQFLGSVYLPFARRRWKESTRGTTEQRIRHHFRGLADASLQSLSRDRLQDFLDGKAASGLSFSVVDHLRWDLSAILSLAMNDGLLRANPAAALFTPRESRKAIRNVMTAEDVVRGLAALELRERLIVKLAVLAGLRPGEILGLRWPSVKADHAVISQRVYRGKVDTPKTDRSSRTVAFPRSIAVDLATWRELETDRTGWVFPSETGLTPLSRDNVWNRMIAPVWSKLGLRWATFQVMRRTYASLAKEAGADPKVTADQMGHGIGVNLDQYTRSGLSQLADVGSRVEALLPEEQISGRVM